jgi:type II secretion system protein N
VKKVLYALVAAVIFLFGLWQIVITDSMVSALIENSLKDSDISVDITNLKKGLFFNLTLDRIILKKSGNTLLSIENASGKINPLSLFIMRLTLHFSGDIGGGRIDGGVNLFKKKNLIDMDIRNAHIEEIPFFALIGLDGKGVLSGELRLENGKGETRLEIKETELNAGTFGGVAVPLQVFDNARGAISISSGMLKVVSFSLEGKGIYARIKGTITGGRTDLTMELMPDKTFSENNPVFSLIESYKVSPGFYSIPINSNLPF